MDTTNLIEHETDSFIERGESRKKLRVLIYTTLFPNSIHPLQGNFILERMRHLRKFADMSVVAPVPYFPQVGLNARWSKFASVPRTELFSGFEVDHPRYVVLPKIGMATHGVSMFAGSIRQVLRRLQAANYDLIDAHYVYPDGMAATMLGRLLKKPVVISARGTDINVFSKLPLIRPLVRRALTHADGLIAVSQSLKDIMVGMGCADEKIRVIGNGVDPLKFKPQPRLSARQTVGLPNDRSVVLSVGHLVELKGFHILIDAIARLRSSRPDLMLVVVGDGPYRPQLERQVRDLGLENQIYLARSIPHDQLAAWYSAADVFCLASSREGWPNVVLEAMACGLPVLATRVGGIPEIVMSQSLGCLVDRTPEAFANALDKALDHQWDRDGIVSYARTKSWDNVAARILDVYTSVIPPRRTLHSSI